MEVTDMALLSVIRRWHFRKRYRSWEIERRTGLSSNTIRKYLRAGTVKPRFKIPERQYKLDPVAEKLSAWLRIEASRSRKQRRTAKQMHADLAVRGYDGYPPRSGIAWADKCSGGEHDLPASAFFEQFMSAGCVAKQHVSADR